MKAIDDKDFFSTHGIENPQVLYAKIRSIAPVCQIGEMRAFFVGTHAAVEEAVKRHEDFSANLNAMLVCSDDEAAKAEVFQLVEAAGMRPIDAGPLANAVAAEALTPVLLHINKKYGVKGAGIRITGLP